MSLERIIDELQNVSEIDKLRLKVEYYKAKVTIISILVSFTAIISTIIFNKYLEEKRFEIDFELKVVEIIMSSKTPREAINKQIVLQELFPNRVSVDFAKRLKNLYDDVDKK